MSAQNVDSALYMLATGFPQEKIYIHYDKGYYVSGETIWFKAYLYSNGKPSSLSSNLYLQFADSKGQIISSKKYPVMGAVARGNIDIPDSLPQGNYYIRALTPYMLNFDEAFVYRKNIVVFKPNTPKSKETVSPTQTLSLQFFPEGGHMVDGLLSVVAFKATDQWGMPVELNGTIRTEEGTTIAPFKTYHDGIGKVQFKPQAGKKYSAEIEINGGKRTFPLPAVQPGGINLKVLNEKSGKMFQLSRGEKGKQDYETVSLVVQMNNQVVYNNEITFENYPSVQGHLVTDSLPSGILHFTVFDKNGMPLVERLSFVDNGEYNGGGSFTIVQPGMEKRAENIVEVNFPDAIQRSASVAVTDASGISLNNTDNIFSRFLLTGELKGYIYNPAWYFEKQTDSTRQALDNLMLTHGWSRFTWTKLLSGNFPEKKIVDGNLIFLSGVVKDDKDKEVMGPGKLNIYLEAEDSTAQNFEADVDAKGRFVLDSMLFRGKSKLFYAYLNNQGKTRPAKIHIDENVLGKIVEALPADFAAGNSMMNPGVLQNATEVLKRSQYAQTSLDQIKQLESVTVKTTVNKKPIDIVNEKYTSGVFKSMGKENLDVINDPPGDRAMNVVDYIKNRIQQVELQGNRFVNRKNFSLMTGQKWTVAVFLNEVPTEVALLRTLRADQLALVKFYEAGFVGSGSGAPGGAIAVYTKEMMNEPQNDKLEYVEYNGYSITREFYSPDYKQPDAKTELTDNRTTLYWSPDVYTDSETKTIKLRFFNNDFSKKFRVIVEGFDANGRLIHLEKMIGD